MAKRVWLKGVARVWFNMAALRLSRRNLFLCKPTTSLKYLQRRTINTGAYLLSSKDEAPRQRRTTSKFKAVIFDLGGVVIPSPIPLITQFEKTHDIALGSVNATIRHYGHEGSFARLERGELTLESFCEPFAREYTQLNGTTLGKEQVWVLAQSLAGVGESGLVPFKEMREVMVKLRKDGIKTAILTNNFKFDNGDTVYPRQELEVDLVWNMVIVHIGKYLKYIQ